MIQQTKTLRILDRRSDELSDTDHYFCNNGEVLALLGKDQHTKSDIMQSVNILVVLGQDLTLPIYRPTFLQMLETWASFSLIL